ncbi:MAG: glycosyl transferase group 1 [Cyanobacteria bacterium RYN_339]|nr:glycosyl transferase group 1 [Cyanobacteria bacterium RYN_339]
MRIALVALSCPDGGMLHYTSQLANALAARAEVHLFTPDRPEVRAYLDSRVRLHGTTGLSRPHETLRNYLRQLNPLAHAANAAAVRAVQPDVVHVVTDHPSNGLLLALLGPVPVVFTHHDPVRHPGEGHRVKQWLTDDVARAADRVIVHADALVPELRRLGLPAGRAAVIPHGEFGFMRRYAPDVREEPMILCFGRLIRYKGVDDLCRAERLLRGRIGPYRIVIAGEGDTAFFRDEIAPDAPIEVIDRFLDDAEAADLFARARLVALPYVQASQSGVLAIAAAFGKPSIVTAVGGLPEAVDHGRAGVIIPPRDPAALAGAIAALWDDAPRRAALGAAGRALVDRSIGWPRIATLHLALYADLQGKQAMAA